MALLLQQLSLYVVMLMRLTSSESTTSIDDDCCTSTHQLLSQLNTAVSQLVGEKGQVEQALDQMANTNHQLSTTISQLVSNDDNRLGRVEQLLTELVSTVSQLNSVVSQLTSTVTQLTANDVSDQQTTTAQMPMTTSQLQTSATQLQPGSQSTHVPDLYPDILIQQNLNNGSSAFNRSWHDYKHGFNASDGSYWIGNDRLHQLTTTGRRYKLRIELQSRSTSQWYWAEYSNFTVLNEADNYRLQIGGYTGNAGRDRMTGQNGMMFTTYDRDNDRWSEVNCARFTDESGGFWYHWCSNCRLTSWGRQFLWYALPGGYHLSASRMRLVAA